MARFLLKGQKLSPTFFIGFVTAIAGIILISFNGRLVLQLNPLGDILTILSALSWAFYSVLTRIISDFSQRSD